MLVYQMVACETPREYEMKRKKIRRNKIIYITVYLVNFTGIAILFFTAFIP